MPQRYIEVVRVDPNFALADDRLLVLMDKFDRILDSHDVDAAVLIDQIDDSRQRRGLAGASRSRNQHQAISVRRKILYLGRHAQIVKRTDFGRNQPADGCRRAALRIDVHTNSQLGTHRKREVHLVMVLENRLLVRSHLAVAETVDLVLAKRGNGVGAIFRAGEWRAPHWTE